MKNLKNSKCCFWCQNSGGGYEETDYCYYCLFNTEWPKDRNDKEWYNEHFVNETDTCDNFNPNEWFKE
jgi:hypothetical protein